MALQFIENSATISTTEHSLATNTSYDTGDAQTSDGVVQVFVDLNALANGDTFRLRVYEKCRSADTQRLAWESTFANVQGLPIAVTPALTLAHGWDVTLTKLGGTDRAIPWSIRRLPA
jgi:hypothetical protein